MVAGFLKEIIISNHKIHSQDLGTDQVSLCSAWSRTSLVALVIGSERVVDSLVASNLAKLVKDIGSAVEGSRTLFPLRNADRFDSDSRSSRLAVYKCRSTEIGFESDEVPGRKLDKRPALSKVCY